MDNLRPLAADEYWVVELTPGRFWGSPPLGTKNRDDADEFRQRAQNYHGRVAHPVVRRARITVEVLEC